MTASIRLRAGALSAALLLSACAPLHAGEADHGDGAVEHGPGRATSHRSFADVEQWRKVFEAPERLDWQMPERVVAALRLKPGQSVADLGAGTGYFTVPLARAVGANGTVYAVEIEPNLVAHLRQRADDENMPQVVPVLASHDTPRLPRGGVDLILVVDTFHHLDHRAEYLPKLAAALTPRGRLVVIDWKKEPLPEGPPLDHKLASDEVIAEVTAAGFEVAERPEFLPYQYFLIFRKTEATTWQERGVGSEE